jgi:hypothetical protein
MQDPKDQKEMARAAFEQGQRAFESGQYRQSVQALEQAIVLAAMASPLHGEIQVWLVMAYDATGDRVAAIALCKKTTRHPQWATRQEAKRLLYILEAPALARSEDWVTKIPDLTTLDRNDDKNWGASPSNNSRPPVEVPKGYVIPAPTDPTQVEVEDRRFVWVVLGGIAIVLMGLVWWA